MKIIIEDEGRTLTLSNENFNVDNFVNVRISGELDEEIDVPISDLYTAVKALYEDRTRQRQADNLLK